LNILVIEPDFENTKKYSEMIVAAGAEVEHVMTARETLNKIRKNKYQGIFISKWLPDMTGDLLIDLIERAPNLDAPQAIVVESPGSDELTILDYLRTVLKSGDS